MTRARPGRADELESVLLANSWMVSVLEAVRAAEPPELWVGAGALRDVVWDTKFSPGFDEAHVKDVDVVYFDAQDSEGEDAIRARLENLLPGVPWEVTNQATVHTWYEGHFGVAVEPLVSVEDGIATWPEYETTVGVRLNESGSIEIIAPLGLDDLLDGIWRRNPRRVTLAEAQSRLARKNVAQRWPSVRVAAEASSGG